MFERVTSPHGSQLQVVNTAAHQSSGRMLLVKYWKFMLLVLSGERRNLASAGVKMSLNGKAVVSHICHQVSLLVTGIQVTTPILIPSPIPVLTLTSHTPVPLHRTAVVVTGFTTQSVIGWGCSIAPHSMTLCHLDGSGRDECILEIVSI